MITYTRTLTAAGQFDINTGSARVANLILSNTGTGSVVYGVIPGGAVVRDEVTTVSGESFVTLAADSQGLALEQGMLVTGTGIGSSAAVDYVQGNKVYLTVANSASGTVSVTFTPPPISSTNGHPLPGGSERAFSAADARAVRGLRVLCVSDTTLVVTIQ